MGYQRFGVNPGGAMDKKAVRLINCLLNNNEDEATIELHFPAPKITFEGNAIIALGGADFSAKIDDEEISNWRPTFVEKGATLTFTGRHFGRCVYLSVKGGFKVKKWLGSYSTNLLAQNGGFHGRLLQKGDRIQLNKRFSGRRNGAKFKLADSVVPAYSPSPVVRFVPGSEWGQISSPEQKRFQEDVFVVTPSSNRMGYALSGKDISLKKKFELVSSPVNFGTVQLLPSGQMVLLMADHQTTGGYPRIANIITDDLPLLAQLNPNDKIRFKSVSQLEAENLALDFEKDLKLLRMGVTQRERITGSEVSYAFY